MEGKKEMVIKVEKMLKREESMKIGKLRKKKLLIKLGRAPVILISRVEEKKRREMKEF